MPWRSLAACWFARRIAWPSATEESIATPAAAESGLALNVPAWAILARRFSSAVGFVGRTQADLEPLVPAVEVARELDDVALAREGAGEPHGHVGGLGARRGEANALGARHEAADPLAPLDFLFVTGAVMRAAQRLLAHGVGHLSRVVAEEQGAVAHPVVDVAIAVDVPLVGALGPGDVERTRLHAAVDM